MVVGPLGNKSPDSNRFTLVTPKSENDVRLQATLGNQNPIGLPVGVVREKINNKDPKFEKYYEQMHEIEKKNAIPDRYKEILSKVDEEYDKQKEKNELEHTDTRTER